MSSWSISRSTAPEDSIPSLSCRPLEVVFYAEGTHRDKQHGYLGGVCGLAASILRGKWRFWGVAGRGGGCGRPLSVRTEVDQVALSCPHRGVLLEGRAFNPRRAQARGINLCGLQYTVWGYLLRGLNLPHEPYPPCMEKKKVSIFSCMFLIAAVACLAVLDIPPPPTSLLWSGVHRNWAPPGLL